MGDKLTKEQAQNAKAAFDSVISGKLEVKSNRWKIEQDGSYIRIYHMKQQCIGVDDAGFRQLTELIYKFLELKNNQ